MAKQPKKRAPKPSRRNRDNGHTKQPSQTKASFAMVDLMRKNAQAGAAAETGAQRAG